MKERKYDFSVGWMINQELPKDLTDRLKKENLEYKKESCVELHKGDGILIKIQRTGGLRGFFKGHGLEKQAVILIGAEEREKGNKFKKIIQDYITNKGIQAGYFEHM